MADKIFINDYGSAIWHDGKAWSKVGTSSVQLPDSSMNSGAGDVPFIENSVTYNIADPQGKSVYTPDEEVVANNLYQYDVVVTNTLISIVNPVPVAGVLRCWVQDVGVNIDIYINGIKLYSSGDAQIEAYPINVEVGDIVEVVNSSADSDRVCVAKIYPFVYSH